jgi:hypothetical protein
VWLVVLEAIDCCETPNRSGGEEEVGDKRKTVGELTDLSVRNQQGVD